MTRYGVYKDGKLKGVYSSEAKAFYALHRLQPFSVSYAIRYEGWKLKKMPVKRKKK